MNGYARSDKTTFVSGDEVTRGWEPVLARYKRDIPTAKKWGLSLFPIWKSRRSGWMRLSSLDAGN